MALPTSLTFHNVGSPTGLKFELGDASGARALFDFGIEHSPGRFPFSLGLHPRPGRELADLIAVGGAPRLGGVYARAHGMEGMGGWDGRTAVFISHLHLDHTGLVRWMDPEVPLHYPAAMEPVRAAADAAGEVPWRAPAGRAVGDREVVAWGDLEVEFVAVDHDVPGASGFLIRTPEAVVAFTGDMWWHGLHPERNEAFVAAAAGCDVLIQEGIGLRAAPVGPAAAGWEDSPAMPTEREVHGEFARLLATAGGLVAVNLYGMNWDRVGAFAEAARAAGRTFCFEPEFGRLAAGPLAGGLAVPVDVDAVRSDPTRFVVQISFDGLPALIDLEPPPGSLFVQAGGLPIGSFDPRTAVLSAWARTFGMEVVQCSTSGHSSAAAITDMVRRIGPRVVLPVHSMAPEALVVPGVPALLPESGRVYRVGELIG